jgi:hypothetical protein
MANYSEIGLSQTTQFETGDQTTENKTAITGNLTRRDIDPVLNNLFTAREELLRSDSPAAFDALSAATSQLFNLTVRLEDNPDEAISEQLKSLQNKIERARNNLLRNNNITAAVSSLNVADSEFIALALKLP